MTGRGDFIAALDTLIDTGLVEAFAAALNREGHASDDTSWRALADLFRQGADLAGALTNSCPACGDPRWVAVSFDGGMTRHRQCVPCGRVRPGVVTVPKPSGGEG